MVKWNMHLVGKGDGRTLSRVTRSQLNKDSTGVQRKVKVKSFLQASASELHLLHAYPMKACKSCAENGYPEMSD